MHSRIVVGNPGRAVLDGTTEFSETPGVHPWSPLVGRNAEVALLEERLARTENGHGALVLLSGEAGLGKTRLVELLSERAGALGMPTHFGRCWEAGGAPAFWPWLQAVRSVLRQVGPGPLERIPATQRARLGQLLPELGPAIGAEPEHLEPEQARFQLMDGLSLLLCEAATERPLVLALEDLHGADASSLALLEFVEPLARAVPLLLVGTFRPAEAETSGPQSVLATLSRRVPTINLGPLSFDAVQHYFEQCARRGDAVDAAGEALDEPSRDARELYRLTEGHPLFMVELVRLQRQLGHFPDAAALPRGVLGAIEERLRALPNSALWVLERASVLGRELSERELSVLLSEGEPARRATQPPEPWKHGGLRDELLRAVDAQVLMMLEDGRYRFAHMLVREVLYRRLAPPLRARLHGAHARSVQQSAAREPSAWFEAAHHFLESDAVDEALHALERAADLAHERLALDEAVRLLSQALETARIKQPESPALVVELELRLARALMLSGQVAQGRALCHLVSQQAQVRGDAELLGRAALLCGSVYLYATVDPKLVQLLNAALEATPEANTARRAELEARLAAALQPSSEPERPIALARKAIAAARSVGDPELLLRVIRSACSALMDLAAPEERAELNQEYIELADARRNAAEAFRGCCRLAFDVHELGDLDRARALVATIAERAERLDHPYYGWRAAAFQAAEATFSGRFEQAETYWQRALREGTRSRDPNAERAVVAGLVRLARVRGEQRVQPELLERLDRAFPTEPLGRMIACGYLAQCGTLSELRAWFVPSDVQWSLTMRDLSMLGEAVWIVEALGDLRLARQLRQGLMSEAERFGSGGMTCMTLEPPTAYQLARLEELVGDPEHALGHYERAQNQLWQARGLPDWLACVLRSGQLVLRLGPEAINTERWEACRKTVAQARPIAEQLELGVSAARLKELELALAEAAPQLSTPQEELERSAVSPHGTRATLTLRREGEIWCVARGGQAFRLTPTRGLELLAKLVERPHEPVHVLELVGRGPTTPQDDLGPRLDKTARTRYRARLAELQQQLQQAEDWNDEGNRQRLHAEFEALTRELNGAFGLGGRHRPTGAAAERARVNVQRRLKDAVRRIRECSPELGEHLERSVKTGTFCVYAP